MDCNWVFKKLLVIGKTKQIGLDCLDTAPLTWGVWPILGKLPEYVSAWCLFHIKLCNWNSFESQWWSKTSCRVNHRWGANLKDYNHAQFLRRRNISAVIIAMFRLDFCTSVSVLHSYLQVRFLSLLCTYMAGMHTFAKRASNIKHGGVYMCLIRISTTKNGVQDTIRLFEGNFNLGVGYPVEYETKLSIFQTSVTLKTFSLNLMNY